MNIVVCVKQVLDTRVPLIASESVKQKESAPIYLMNPADRIALMYACDIKRKVPKTEIIAITVGPARARQVLRQSLASGSDSAIHIKDDVCRITDEYTAALSLSRVISGMEYDIILCGNQSLDNGVGVVPVFLSELLSIPHITAAMRLEVIPSSAVKIWRRLEKGRRQIVECNLPALFAIDANAGQARYTSEFSLMRVRDEMIKEHNLNDIGLTSVDIGPDAFNVRTVGISSPKPRTKKIYIPDSSMSASQRMSYLLGGGNAGKKQSNLLEGTTEFLSSQIIEYLTKEGIIKK